MTVEVDTTQIGATQIITTRRDRARQLGRKVVRNARDKNKWRKVVKVRLWMPVALQVLLIIALLWYTNSRFPGFINQANITTVLLLAMPLALAAIAQTHAILVGYLDLSVGAMISFGVVVGSFLIGAKASTWEILVGVAAVLACGFGLGLVNAVLIRGVKIPSLIATLATLSILDGISLTLRPTAQGVISDDLVSVLRKSVGPVPVAFIVIVIGAGLLDVWLHASGSGLAVRAVGFDERAAKRGGIRTNWIRVRALVISACPRRGRIVVRHGPLADRQRPDRQLVRAQQHHRRGPWRGRAFRRSSNVRRKRRGSGPACLDHDCSSVSRTVADRRVDDRRPVGAGRDHPLPGR